MHPATYCLLSSCATLHRLQLTIVILNLHLPRTILLSLPHFLSCSTASCCPEHSHITVCHVLLMILRFPVSYGAGVLLRTDWHALQVVAVYRSSASAYSTEFWEGQACAPGCQWALPQGLLLSAGRCGHLPIMMTSAEPFMPNPSPKLGALMSAQTASPTLMTQRP